MTKTKLAQYELTASKKGCVEVNGKLEVHEGRLTDLPDRPAELRPMVGTYVRISTEAVRRNKMQERSGFLDYLYAPEPYAPKGGVS